MTEQEDADRLAIRELVDTYAYRADHRDAVGQAALFTEDAHVAVFADAKDPTPSQDFRSRAQLVPGFRALNKYTATTHFNGQSTIHTLAPDRATGETTCLAHHLTAEGTNRRLMVLAIRYADQFVKKDGAWLFAERLLYLDWQDERELSQG
jgi:hypothetical protein